MDFLRRHLFLILCGIGAAGGIALGITGLQAMPKVGEEMKKSEAVYRNLEGLQNQPVNRSRIEAENRRIELVREDHAKVIDKAKELYGYELLVPEILPYGDPEKRLEFRRRYHAAMRDLLSSLKWGRPAGTSDVQNARDLIANEEAERKQYDANPNPLIPRPKAFEGPPKSPADVLTKAGAQTDPVARANLQVAQRIFCYARDFGEEKATDQIVPSLDFEPIMANLETADPPYPEEVWRAQLGYWIQKDVIEAIVAINEEAAKAITDASGYPWVGVMPVKDVISVRLFGGFISPQGDVYYGAAPGGTDKALPPGTAATVFTGSGSGESFDVVQFTVKLVMDQRDIPLFLERLSNGRFYVPLRVAYKAIPPNKKMTDKIYGSEPTVSVVMDFETVLLGQVFRRWMPKAVRDGVTCRPIDECEEPPQ